MASATSQVAKVPKKAGKDSEEGNVYQDVEFSRDPKIAKIIIPEDMPFAEVARWALEREREDETPVSVFQSFDTFPLDGAFAFMKALKEIYGWTSLKPTPGFFGPTPPALISVKVGPDTMEQVPWGTIEIPGVDGSLQTMSAQDRPQFILTGTVKQKHASQIKKIVKVMERVLREESIYRGKAFRVSFGWLRETNNKGHRRDYDLVNDVPQFIDVEGIRREQLIFADSTMRRIQDSIFNPIEKREACRKRGMPGKRGVLLSGRYGTGKTLTAKVTAKIATDNNTTFMLLEDVRDLAMALKLARHYAPCVVFAEDVDRALEGERSGESGVTIDNILNTIDGVDSKGIDIMTILTTNHVERIEPAMLRPGRIDDVIDLPPPDAKAAIRLVMACGGSLLDPNADYTEVGKALSGKIPAIIDEVLKRAKVSALTSMTDEQLANPQPGEIGPEALLTAAASIEAQQTLIDRRPDSKKLLTDVIMERIGESLVNGVQEAAKAVSPAQLGKAVDEELAHRRAGQVHKS